MKGCLVKADQENIFKGETVEEKAAAETKPALSMKWHLDQDGKLAASWS